MKNLDEEPPSDKLDSLQKKTDERDVLKCQYMCAVDLYKHEDELNWKKIHNLFYVTSALLFILSFVSVGNFPHDIEPIMLGTLSASGVLISTSFGFTLWYGVLYLLARKEKVIQIEKMMETCGAISIVGDFRTSNALDVSPTTKILKFIPFIFSAGWTILLIYSLIKILNIFPL